MIGQVLPVDDRRASSANSLLGELVEPHATDARRRRLSSSMTRSLNPCAKSASDSPALAPSRKSDRDMQMPPETQVVIDFDDNRARFRALSATTDRIWR